MKSIHSSRTLPTNCGQKRVCVFIEADFTKQSPEPLYNLVLTNPPTFATTIYLAPEKKRLKAQLANSLRLDISGSQGYTVTFFRFPMNGWMSRGLQSG